MPGSIAPAIGIGVQITAGIYHQVESRKKQNDFLLKMNDAIFRPRGLYCLVMSYKPGSSSTYKDDHVNARINGEAGLRSKFRGNDGEMGSIEFPASAELTFPDLEDSSSDEDDDEGGAPKPEPSMGKKAMATVSKWVEKFENHQDVRAQRRYMKRNPYSDLNGSMNPDAEAKMSPRDRERQEKKARRHDRRLERRERRDERRGKVGMAPRQPRKRRLAKDMLYMMIVNMPKQDEMEHAARLVGDKAGYVEKVVPGQEPQYGGPPGYGEPPSYGGDSGYGGSSGYGEGPAYDGSQGYGGPSGYGEKQGY
ncbi:hypothetical protein F5Y15DRAFT_390825 [Xylariaceae sp. FL0016]|nr:hypothetical protein F5Y15DRAFT_390825 [Xylariaceae sp. FL0016]